MQLAQKDRQEIVNNIINETLTYSYSSKLSFTSFSSVSAPIYKNAESEYQFAPSANFDNNFKSDPKLVA